MNFSSAVLAASLLLPLPGFPQDAVPTQFDVVSVRPHKPGDTSMQWVWSSSGFRATNMRLLYLITSSYNVQPFLVSGLPAWEGSTHWDVEAKVVDPNLKSIADLTLDQQHVLILNMLRDRFGMVAHKEEKVQPVFLMTVLPGGPKMQKSPPWPADKPVPKFGTNSWYTGSGSLTGERITMDDIAAVLSNQVERRIIDRTGLTGQYSISLHWTPEKRADAGDNGAENGPPLVEAVKEQLGLKLTADKAPVPTVVVETLVKPEEN